MWQSSPACAVSSLSDDNSFVRAFDLCLQGLSARLDHQADKLLAYLRKLLALYHLGNVPFAPPSPRFLATSLRNHPGQISLTGQTYPHPALRYSAKSQVVPSSRSAIPRCSSTGVSTPTLQREDRSCHVEMSHS